MSGSELGISLKFFTVWSPAVFSLFSIQVSPNPFAFYLPRISKNFWDTGTCVPMLLLNCKNIHTFLEESVLTMLISPCTSFFKKMFLCGSVWTLEQD